MATATAKRGASKVKVKAKPKPALKAPPKKKRTRSPKGQGKSAPAQQALILAVKADNPQITSDEFAVKFNLPVDEVARHKMFVLQYTLDYNIKAAALRMGYPDETAWETGYRMLNYAYAQLFLSECQRNATVESVVNVGQLMSKAWEEANRADTVKDGCAMTNSTTRLGWAKLLAQMMGVLTPVKKDATPTLRRVMHVGPQADDWGQGAKASQAALIRSTAVDV